MVIYNRHGQNRQHKLRFISAPLFLMLKSCLLLRTFSVRFNDGISNIRPINACLPQGSILARLSPYPLYCIYFRHPTFI